MIIIVLVASLIVCELCELCPFEGWQATMPVGHKFIPDGLFLVMVVVVCEVRASYKPVHTHMRVRRFDSASQCAAQKSLI